MRGIRRWLAVLCAFAIPFGAAAFNSSDVERLESGENDLRNADLSGLNQL